MGSTYIILVYAALLNQVFCDVKLDTFVSTRRGATLSPTIDPNGFSRLLKPNVDPLGHNYGPVTADAIFPITYEPFGASRPGGLSYAGEANGYIGLNRPNAFDTPGLHGYSVVDGWYNYEPHLSTVAVTPVLPESGAATLVTTDTFNLLPLQPVVIPVSVASHFVPIS